MYFQYLLVDHHPLPAIYTPTLLASIIYSQNEVSFNISFSVGIMAIIFLSFCVYENIFISQSFVINISLDECTFKDADPP